MGVGGCAGAVQLHPRLASGAGFPGDVTLIFPPRGLHIVGTGTPGVCDTNKPEKMKRKPSPVRDAGLHVSSKFMKM